MQIRERAVRTGAVVAIAVTAGAVLLTPSRRAAAFNGGDDDRPILTFSTVGDSRQDPVGYDPTTGPLSGQDATWLENSKALARIMREVNDQGAQLFVFDGDMIMGYGAAVVPANNGTVDGIVSSDLMAFYRQYGFWRGMAATLMEQGTYVVPVPGNHETQWKAGGKVAIVENENAWRNNMSDLILDDQRFTNLFNETPTYEATGDNRNSSDGLATDQSKLTYSFDFRGSHFAIVNTDPVGHDSHAPWNWLAQDFADAQARGATNFFVFGHKPAFTYYYGKNTQLPTKPAGLDVDAADRDSFWSVVEQYHATYFCGHEHIFDVSQPWTATGGKSWQILVGSGGSPFEALPTDVTINPQTDRDYAWATVNVYKSGVVRITAYGFDDQFGRTRMIARLKIN